MRFTLWGNFADSVNTRRAPGGVRGEARRPGPAGADGRRGRGATPLPNSGPGLSGTSGAPARSMPRPDTCAPNAGFAPRRAAESPRRAPCGAQAPGRDRPARRPAALSRRVAPVRQAAVAALVAVAALFAFAAPAQAQTEPVWSTTMTVGETTNGDSRGYYFYEANGALDIRFFKAGSTDYGVLALLAGEFTPTANSDPGLAFWVSSEFSDYADYTLEFAGETLPLADGTFSTSGGVVEFSPAWLTTNAPSLSAAQFETTLAIGAQVQACLRTATQVCPPRTEAVWSTTMTVGETSGDTVGFRDAGDSTAGGSLDSESFTTAGSTYTVKQLDVGRYNDWLIFETNPPLSSLDSYTLEFAGETLPLSDSSNQIRGVFTFTWLAANAPSLSATQFETTLAVDNEVAVCLRTASQVCPEGTTIVPTSSDATLSGLALADSNGNTISLGETFMPATTAYAAFVANGIETVTLTATKNDSNATVAITSDDDTTSRGEAELDLMVGPNTLTVTVTAQDGATMQPYTITVTRAAACTDVWCATLTVQSLSDGRFGCASSQSGKECSAYLTEDEFTHDSTDYEVSGLQLTANGELRLFLAPPSDLTTASQSLVLLVDSERFPFAYADTKEGRARYWTNSELSWSSGDIVDVRLVEATASNDTTLSDLEIVDSNGDTVALSPPFADDETDYTASVEDGVLQVTVTVAASDASNKLDYLDRNGNALSDADTGATGHQVVLDAGETIVQVQVTAEDGATMTYRVSVMRMLTTGATGLVSNLGEGLSNVTSGYNVTGQSFTTGSNPGGYRLTAVALRVNSHNNFASDSDTHVTLWSIVNNGPGAMIAELTSPPLGTGTRTYTAPAGVFLDPNRSYRVLLNYGLSQNSRARVRLTDSNRETSGYGWTIGNGLRYNASSHPTSWTGLDASMSMRIEGEELPTSSDATLTDLALKNASDDSAVALNETFSSTLTTYTATVANGVTSITVEPEPGNASAEVAYLNASDVELTDADPNKTGFQADLTEGDNVIQVQVTAQDDNTTLTYEVTVRREAATTANAVWSTTMTVGETTSTGRGFASTAFFPGTGSGGSLGRATFTTTEGDDYRVAILYVNIVEGLLIQMDSGPNWTNYGDFTLEFAGETLPLSDATDSNAQVRFVNFDDTWLAANAPSLSLANYLTTLPVDAMVPVCLRTASQVCPDGGTTVTPTTVSIEPNYDSIGAGLEDLVFTLTREGATTDELEATVTIVQAESWLGNSDLSHTVTFTVGDDTATLTLGASRFSFDPDTSGNLTATVTGAGIAGASAPVTIISTADAPITVSYDMSSYTFAEDAAPADVIINVEATLDSAYPRAPSRKFRVGFSTRSDTAISPGDYGPISWSPEFLHADYGPASGGGFVARKRLENNEGAYFSVEDDDVYEGTERLGVRIEIAPGFPFGLVQIAYSDGSTCAPTSSSCVPRVEYPVTITDEEDRPVLSLSAVPASIAEEDDDTTTTVAENASVLTVAAASPKTFATEQTITLTFTGSAVYGTHYNVTPVDADANATGHQVTLPAETASVQVTVTAAANDTVDGHRSIDVTGSRDGTAFGTATTITLLDDETTTSTDVSIEAEHESIGGGVEDLKYTLTRTGATTDALTVTVTLTQDQNWLTSTDRTHEVEFAAGEATKELIINDSRFSFDPTTSGNLVATVTGTGVAGGSDTVEIISIADPPITLAFDQDAYTFPEGGPANDVDIYVTATLDAAFPRKPSSNFFVVISTSEGTATSPEDYANFSRFPSFKPSDFTADGAGQQVARLLFGPLDGNPLDIVDDNVYEVDETFNVRIQHASGFRSGLARVKKADGTFCVLSNLAGGCDSVPYPVTITDDDLPTLSLVAVPASIAEEDDDTTTSVTENVSVLTVAAASPKTFATEQTITLTFGGSAVYGTHYSVSPVDTDANTTGHQVLLPAETPSVEVTVTAVDNASVDGGRTIEVAGSRDGMAFGTATTITLLDDDTATTNLPWSTTMTVGETTGDGRGYRSSGEVRPGGSLDTDSFTTGGVPYRVLRLDVSGTRDAAEFKLNSALSSYADYTLEFAGETLPLASTTYSLNNREFWFNNAWLAANAPSLSSANFETTLAVDAMVSVCLRTASQVCPGGGTTVTNTPAAGQPGISGTAQVGQTLTATTSSISDADGKTKAENGDTGYAYTYQWILVDGNNETEISGETSSAYTPSSSDVGKTIRVKVSFIDDLDNAEGPFTSDQTAAVTVANLLWSTTMTVGEGSSGGRGYYFDEAVGELVIDSVDSFEIGSTDYQVLALLAGPYAGDSSKGLVFWTNNAILSYAEYTLEFAGETLPLADATPNNTGKILEFSPEWLTANASTLNAANFETTLPVNAMAPVCLRTATEVCPGGGITTTNTPATGQPGISGTPQVGQMLTAGIGTIADVDDLPPTVFPAGYSFQWVRVDSSNNETDVGTDSIGFPVRSTYSPTSLDVGSTIKVKVSFIDNAGNSEGPLTSDAYPASGTIAPATTTPPPDTDVLVGNTGERLLLGGTSSIGAQSLVTGSNAGGYAVSAVQIRLKSVSGKTTVVKIKEDNNGEPGDLVATLTNPASLSANKINTFTAPPGTTFAASTTYWITRGEGMTFAITAATDETGEPGWSIGDSRLYRTSETLPWFTSTQSSLMIAIKGAAIGAASDDATLSALTVNDGTSDLTLDPAFAPGTFAYAADVDNAVTTVTLTAMTTDDGASVNAVTLGGIAIADTDFTDGITVPSLLVDDNDIVVTVTAENGDTRTYTLTVTRQTAVNNPATGAPAISGTAQVGQTLTAATTDIADADGLANPSYDYQWVRVDGSSETDITGATSSTYMPVAADVGKKLKVKVSFTDDASNNEELTSDAYPESRTVEAASTTAPTTVTISADKTSAVFKEDDITYTVTRTGSTTAALPVTVLLTQTADFLAATELTKTVTIGADQSTATFTVAASSFQHFAAGTKVGGGTLTATVQDGSAYNPGTTNSVEVDIVIGVMIGFEMAAYSVDEAISLFRVKVIAHTGPGAGQPTSEATYSILPADDSATNPRDFFFVDIPASFLVNNFLESGAVWQAEHNYVVQITNDQEVEDDETFDLRIEQRDPSTATYSLVDASGNSCGSVCTATVTIIDDDTPGVTVSPTALTVMEEDTTGDSYTVVLDTEPTANVTVTVAGHSGTDVTPTPVSLTFTASNWDAAQTVTVTAGNDADPVNDEVTLTHSAASTDSGYSSGITIPSVAVTVRDNDTAVAASICGRTDKVRDELLRLIENNVGAAVACADVTTTHLAAITGALDLSGQNIAELTAGDFAGLTGLTELSLYNNKLRSLPGGVFDELGALDILVLARNGLTTLDEDVFDALDKLTELNLQENDLTGLPAGVFDRLRALDILTLDENGLITLPAGVFDRLTELEVLWLDGNDLTELPAGIFNELGALEVLTLRRNSLVRLPDGVFEPLTALKDLWLRGNPGVPFAPGAVALPDDGTVPVAGGAVRLDGRDSGGAWGTNVTYGWALTTPTSGATFNNDTSPTPEVTIEALPANTELTFTLTVTGRGGTDGIDPATDTATVTVTRAASAGVSVTPTALTVTEEDPVGAGYTVVLDTLPMADVTVTVAGHAGTDLTLTPDPVSLTFTPSDWDTAQTVTVTAGDDADKENDTVRLTHAAASRDGNYNGVGIADVAVTVIDNNLVQVTGLTVTPGNTQLMINWTAVGNATGYKVQWKSGSQNYDTTDRQATIALGSTTSHTITGLVNATRYTVRVIATWTGASDGPPSAEAMGRPRGESGGICGRTEEVRGALLDLIEKKEGDIDCADVSAAHLAAITRLDLSGQGIAALKAGDFAGLTGLTQLYLYGNALSSLPGGVFAELSALNNLDLNNNNLSSLPVGVFARLTALTNLTLFNNELTRLSDGVFDGLGSLRALSLDGNGLTALSGGVFDGLTELGYLNLDHNKLTTLPDDVFEPLTALTDLQLVDNDGAPFSPGAVALLPDDGTVPVVGGTVTLDGSDSDGGPWGTNVTYGWALTDPESGVTVTFDDDTSATPVVTIPALAADTELTFTLTVTGGGGAKKKGVVAGADTATVTVTPAARSARSAAIPEHDEAESPPLVSVADVKVREGPGAVLAFNVMLDRASRETATVDWETLNGSAKAGEDYVAASGTLAFGPGETVKTVRVAVIDDAHDEGNEVLLLVLSNAQGAVIGDAVAKGTIENSDRMPAAWLTRFGRAASDHVVEAVGERWQGGPRASHLTIGGRRAGQLFGWAGLGGQAERDTSDDRDEPVGTDPSSIGLFAPSGADGAGLGATAPGMGVSGMNAMPGGPGGVDGEAGRTLSGRAAQGALLRALGLPDPRAVPDLRTVLMSSSFFYSPALDNDGRARSPGRTRSPGWLGEWSAWGRTAATRFQGNDEGMALDGEVATAMLGFDSRWDRWLAGVVVSYSEGQGAYTHPTASGGAVKSTMTGLHPYARFELNERTSVWGVLGYGAGELSLTPERSETALGTDLTNAMAAFGGRTALSVRTGQAGRFELAVRSDARLTSTASEAIEGLVGAAGQTGRVRLMLEGSGSMPLAGGVLKPTLEAGLRYDAGDAETGAGLEVSGGLGYAAGRLSVEINARGLLAHEDTGYEEWGFSGSIAYTPSEDGRGLSMRLGSAWGATQSGVQSLWSRQDASGLVRNAAFDAAQRYQVELRYGFDGRKGHARWEPYVGVESGDGSSRALRLGVTLTSGRGLDAGLELGRRQGLPGADPEHAVQLRGALRW